MESFKDQPSIAVIFQKLEPFSTVAFLHQVRLKGGKKRNAGEAFQHPPHRRLGWDGGWVSPRTEEHPHPGQAVPLLVPGQAKAGLPDRADELEHLARKDACHERHLGCYPQEVRLYSLNYYVYS